MNIIFHRFASSTSRGISESSGRVGRKNGGTFAFAFILHAEVVHSACFAAGCPPFFKNFRSPADRSLIVASWVYSFIPIDRQAVGVSDCVFHRNPRSYVAVKNCTPA